jgi:hypothetical protein
MPMRAQSATRKEVGLHSRFRSSRDVARVAGLRCFPSGVILLVLESDGARALRHLIGPH